MPRYCLTVEYDGTPFVGWQRQENGLAVQQVMEEAITAFSGETPGVMGAGRTDAGVHALGQVVHFDLARDFAPERVMGALNYHMRPHPVVVLTADYAAPDFHARFDATGRRYLYRILNRRAPPAVDRDRVWHVPQPLDAAEMHRAAQFLVGKHDFTTFRAVGCQAESPVKTLDRLSVTRQDNEVRIEAAARSFLHHQVRSMAGTLKLVGQGKWQPGDVKAALEARDRQALGMNAPPYGLYLVRVDYAGTASSPATAPTP